MKGQHSKLFILFCLSAKFCVACSHLIYYPSRNIFVAPDRIDPRPIEDSYFSTQGLTIHGWHFRANPTPPNACILYFHGNGQNRSAHFMTLHWLVKEGFDLFIFDYPGYGQTAGTPTPESTVLGAIDAILHVREKNCPALFVYGHSLGGQIAMRAVSEMSQEQWPDMLVIDSSFLSYKKVARRILAQSPWTWILQPLTYLLFSDKWAITDKLKNLPGLPVLVIHTKTDRVIPFDLGQELYQSAHPPKEFWIKTSGTHNAIYSDPEGLELRKKLVEKLKAHVSGSL